MGRPTTSSSAGKPTIQVSKPEKDQFVRWLNANRRPHQGETVGAILKWFVEQKQTVQQVVLGQYPPEMREDYAKALEAIAQGVREGKDEYDPRDFSDGISIRQPQAAGEEPATPQGGRGTADRKNRQPESVPTRR
jgi:hypothetical protein